MSSSKHIVHGIIAASVAIAVSAVGVQTVQAAEVPKISLATVRDPSHLLPPYPGPISKSGAKRLQPMVDRG
ncbi:hypothetical protein [Subtercola lobariae]|uniref:Uncharacterized protein n=1 Tax=Subtercola lobariae TaxID=1588641 RepID=A0A917EZU2_9MICO|nr:hypothetical protein [Subtercola lobariae]GGF37909.1 hypothetical protein GCM10011399_33620 [Subtercola lobariae]